MKSNGIVKYNIEEITSTHVRGWVVNIDNPDELLSCQLKMGSEIIYFKNDKNRNDLLTKGMTENGLGGFLIHFDENIWIDKYQVFIKFYEEDNFNPLYERESAIDKLKLSIKKIKPKVSNFTEFLIEVGIDTAKHQLLTPKCKMETPTRPYSAKVVNSELGAFSYIGELTSIYNTVIGRYCSIAKGVTIGHGNHPIMWLSTNPFQYQLNFKIRTGRLFSYFNEYEEYKPYNHNTLMCRDVVYKEKTMIGNDVWIGTNSILMAGIIVGDGAIIGAGSIVTKDVPPYAIVGGNPAKIIRYRFSKEIIEELLNLQWWRYSPWDLNEANISFSNIEEAIQEIKIMSKDHKIEAYIGEKYSIEELEILFKNILEVT